MTSTSEQTSASLPDDCQDYLGGNEPCALAPGNCKKCANPKQQPDTETQHEKSLRLLHKYLNETPKEEIKALLDSIKNVGTNGPTVEEYFQSLGGQPDELSKAEHWKKRWETQCEAVDVAQTSVTNLHFELSKAQERIRQLEAVIKEIADAPYLKSAYYSVYARAQSIAYPKEP